MKAVRSKPVSKKNPWLWLHFLFLGSCLELLPLILLIMDYEIEVEVPKFLFGHVLYL